MGYIGPVLYPQLRAAYSSAELWGFDSGYFAHCLTAARYLPEREIDRQLFGDMRSFPFEVLNDVDTIIHLGAISNDPMGNKYEAVTESINVIASNAIAREAKQRGVNAFVFASTCSIYGQAIEDARKETDSLNPLTAYARSKVAVEKELELLANADFKVTALRFATACGMSSRLRLDLVINDFVAGAISRGKITILSDGTPWRPLIHVKDISRAIVWAIGRERSNSNNFIAVNTGSDVWNYQVKDLANSVARLIPGTKVSINQNAPSDKRSYRVDFTLFRQIAPMYQPLMTLDDTILELKEGLEAMMLSEPDFRQSNYMRLNMLETHIKNGLLNSNLEWQVS